MIFIKNVASVLDQEWSSTEKYPGVGWKFLIDADFDGSSGLSLGFAEILPSPGTIIIFPSSRKHSVFYNGKTDRVMIGVNFYALGWQVTILTKNFLNFYKNW